MAGFAGVGLGVWAIAVAENARASRPGLSMLVIVRSERFNIEEAPKISGICELPLLINPKQTEGARSQDTTS